MIYLNFHPVASSCLFPSMLPKICQPYYFFLTDSVSFLIFQNRVIIYLVLVEIVIEIIPPLDKGRLGGVGKINMTKISYKLFIVFLLVAFLGFASSFLAALSINQAKFSFAIIFLSLMIWTFITTFAPNPLKLSGEKTKEDLQEIRAIISSIGEGLLVVDKDHKIIIINETAGKMLRIAPAKAIGADIRKTIVFLKDNSELPLKKWPTNKMFESGKIEKIGAKDNIYLKNKKGEKIPLEITTAPLIKNGGINAVVVLRNITEFKLMEEERTFTKHNIENVLKSVYIERDNVQEEKNKLKATLNSIGDAVLAIDEDRRVIIFNSVAEKITEIKFDNIERKPYINFFRFVDEDTRKEKTEEIDRIIHGEKEMIKDYQAALLVNKKGMIPVDINAALIKNHEGKNMGCIIVFRDVTEKREIERMRSDFISIVSHQLRTPLSAIKWFMEILLEGDVGKLKAKQTEIIKETYENNNGLIKFVNQLLNVSRIENNRLSINPETINLNNEVEKIIKEIKPLLKEKKQKFTFKNLEDESMTIKTDRNLLKNVLDNLLVNASKYTPDNGNIGLEITKKDGDTLLFAISDTGIGIPAREQKKIFGRFSRASNAINYNASGTGLGLYVVKSILNMIGGKIRFESEENKGTTFFLEIPTESPKVCIINLKKDKYI